MQEFVRLRIDGSVQLAPLVIHLDHRDIADRIDRSDDTVGEHLRKIEAQVVEAIEP